jgi:hypothetical protein
VALCEFGVVALEFASDRVDRPLHGLRYTDELVVARLDLADDESTDSVRRWKRELHPHAPQLDDQGLCSVFERRHRKQLTGYLPGANEGGASRARLNDPSECRMNVPSKTPTSRVAATSASAALAGLEECEHIRVQLLIRTNNACPTRTDQELGQLGPVVS